MSTKLRPTVLLLALRRWCAARSYKVESTGAYADRSVMFHRYANPMADGVVIETRWAGDRLTGVTLFTDADEATARDVARFVDEVATEMGVSS